MRSFAERVTGRMGARRLRQGGLLAGGAVTASLLLAAALAFSWGRSAPPLREVLLEARGVKWSGDNPTLLARAGERLRITVRNAEPGPVLHDLRLVGPGTVATRLLPPGEEATVELVLERPGRYLYTCSLHPGLMDGVIEVEAQ